MSYTPKPSRIRGGRVYQTSRHASYRRGKKKDFAWGGRRQNPLKHEQVRSPIKTKLYILLLCVSLIGMAGMLLYHPFFQISHVDIEGNDRISPADIEQTIFAAMDYRYWFLFPGKSFIFVQTKEIEDILNERFPLSTVTVEKTFPNTLSVSIKERLSTLIYDNGDTYYFMALTGKIVEPVQKVTPSEWRIETETVTSTNELGEVIQEEHEVSRQHIPDIAGLLQTIGRPYPVLVSIHDEQHTSSTVSISDEVVKEEYINQIITWYDFLASHSITPRYTNISSPYNTRIYTDGPTISISIAEAGESEAQMSRLETVLKEIQEGTAISAIDIRYSGQVYWQ